jgi:hypothetical protein
MADVNLILEKFEFDPNADHKIVELHGTTAGLMGSLLSLLGLSRDAYLVVTRAELQLKLVRFSGMTIVICPLEKITSASCGISKPVWALRLGIIFLLFFPTIILPLIGVGLLVYFMRAKFLTLTFSTSDMLKIHGLDFVPLTTQGKPIHLDDLIEIVTYVNTTLLKPQPDSVPVPIAAPVEMPAESLAENIPAAEAIPSAENISAPPTMPDIESIMDMEQPAAPQIETGGVYLLPDEDDDDMIESAIPAELRAALEAETPEEADSPLLITEADLTLPIALETETVEATATPGITEDDLTLPPDAEPEDVEAQLAALFGEAAPEPIPPIVPIAPTAAPHLAEPEEIAAIIEETPVEIPIIVDALAEAPVTPMPEATIIPEELPAPAEPASLPPAQDKSQLVDTKPKKPAADTAKLNDTQSKKPAGAPLSNTRGNKPAASAHLPSDMQSKKAQPTTEEMFNAAVEEAVSNTPTSPIFTKAAPGNPDAWKTGEMRAVMPTSGATGTLDLDKQIARSKLREGFDLFQKKKYMDALVALKEAQTLDPDNPKVREGIQACELRLRRQ